MRTVLFLCHGNICRSVGAEFIFNKLIKDKGLDKQYVAYSRALSDEELGHNIYPPMKEALLKHNIPMYKHEARHASLIDIDTSDYILYMDNENKSLLDYQFGSNPKFVCLAKYINKEEIADPWYHRRFDDCFDEIYEAVNNFIISLEK